MELLALRHQVAVYKQRYLLQDCDAIYGEHFQQRLKHMGIEAVQIVPRSPWQNPYCERVIGSICHDVLDHVIVLNARHLRRLLTAYLSYYHRFRIHLALDMDCPVPRAVEPPEWDQREQFPKRAVSIIIMSASLRENEGYVMASSRPKLEQRVTDLDAEVHNLKRQVDTLTTVQPWWEQIIGTFEDDPIYDEAMKLGQHYRQSLRPKTFSRRQK
jgi:hypothetical protein